MSQLIQAPRGTFDIFGEEQKYWNFLRETFFRVISSFSFERIDLPLFEYKSIFEKSVGKETDIVQKQMFFLKRETEEGDEKSLVLRPEGTASVCRAYIEHGMQTLPQPVKLYYFGPMFRYEKPQKGRFREHYQFGFEILGASSPSVDAFVIGVAQTIYQNLGLSNFVFEINSLGCKNCRSKIKKAILDFYRPSQIYLCQNCRERYLRNPLRLLDCKEERCQKLIQGAPPVVDYLCEDCKKHFMRVLEFLDELSLPYDLNPHLVRGLDYYTNTVFEVIPEKSKNSIGSGGRYNDLIEFLGGKPTPSCGFAGGSERTIEEIKNQEVPVFEIKKPDIVLIQLGDLARKKALSLLFNLQKENFKINSALNKESLKSQLRQADKLKAHFALILGQKEAQEGTIIVRNMLDGSQETVYLKNLVNYLKKRIGGTVKRKIIKVEDK